MKLPLQLLKIRAACTMLIGATLAACGGGTPEQYATASLQGSSKLDTNVSVSMSGSRSLALSTVNTAGATAAATSVITDVRFESTSSTAQTNVPVTFGQVFAAGHLVANTALEGRLDNGAMIPLQLDVKAVHPDGSVRHAVISAVLPSLAAGQTQTLSLLPSTTTAAAPAAASALLAAGFTSSFNATVNGVRYSASADQLIKNGKMTSWLAGAEANEWHVSAPLTSNAGIQHPHLAARFAIRWYPAAQKARVDVAIENNWAYEAAPQNFTYDADFVVGGKSVYTKTGMTHLHHARWRKLAWWGSAAPEVNVKHNSVYLIGTSAVPNYDLGLKIPEAALSNLKAGWTGPHTEPMGVGIATSYMPMTGGRGDIGLLPSWTAMYVLSMDKRAREVTLGTADLSGSWPSHYRDKKTGHPVSLVDYPYMTILGRTGDTFNPSANRSEAFPSCAAADLCNSPHTPDTSHQPNLAYVPYLVTGDYYYLEELQFWGMWSAFSSNPNYRGFEKGLVQSDQVRGQAWTLRTLAEAAYITPDSHPLKSHFMQFVDANLDWFNKYYAMGASTGNKLGIITNGYALSYDNGNGIAPWQDDFFTSAIGHASDLGFTKATTFLHWKAKFAIDRMVGEGACWIMGSIYNLKVRENATSPYLDTYAKAFAANNPEYVSMECASTAMATKLGLKVGEMLGYAAETIGYPANMQPALAYAADINSIEGRKAWEQFEKRSQKPDYSKSPQFAIRPKFSPVSEPLTTLITVPAPTPESGATNWIECATEGSICTFNGTVQVRYGTPTAYYVRTATDSISCSNTVFGDPAVNVIKSCSVVPDSLTSLPPVSPATPAPAEGEWIKCATEGGTCAFSGTRQVRYGTALAYFTKTATATVACSNAVFGDPVNGTVKSCSYSATPVPETWTSCATEGGTCNVPGNREVRYGADGSFVSKVLNGSVSCSNHTFGDPKPNTVKTCSFSSIAR